MIARETRESFSRAIPKTFLVEDSSIIKSSCKFPRYLVSGFVFMSRITIQNGKLNVPNNPQIPLIRGDGVYHSNYEGRKRNLTRMVFSA